VQRSILLGLGPSNYYYQTLDIPILGWYVSFSSHNQYVDLVAQFGILGLIAFCWFVFEILRVALRLRARIRDAFAHSYLTGALAGLVGTLAAGMLADWIVPFYYNIGIQGFRSSLLFWFFVGAIIALHRIFSEDAEAGVEAAT
jgi:O-antigen ligase